jgi:hypothetical protein
MKTGKTAPRGVQEGERIIPYMPVGRLKRALPHRLARDLGIAIDAATPVTMSIPEAGKRFLGIGKELAYAVSYPVTSEVDR